MLLTVLLSILARSPPPLMLVKNDVGEWSKIVVAGEKPILLGSIDFCVVVLEPDAELLVDDLDGDGVSDLALWSPSNRHCMVVWWHWSASPRRPPQELGFVCRTVQALDVCASDAGLVVFRNKRPVQLVTPAPPVLWIDPQLVDFTFDGVADLVLGAGPCTGNCWHTVLPFDTRRKRFVASTAMARLSSPEVVDSELQLIESMVSKGQAGAVFEGQLLAVRGTEAQVIGEAKQYDDPPGSVTKRLVVKVSGKRTCEALVNSETEPPTRKVLSGCEGWPLFVHAAAP